MPQNLPEKYGLFRLHPKPREPYNAYDFDVDIVAIHGLGGHAMNTWTDKDGHLWLRDSLPSHVPRARTMTFGYDSSVLLGKSRMTINDFAVELATRLELEREKPQERNRPLIFICHSLGGVVFKEFLVHVSLQLDDCRHLTQSVSGVVFMGTPHRGSKVASPAQLLSRIVNVATLGTLVRTDLLRILEVSSAELETISRHATLLLKSLTVISFYEQKPLGATLIVEPFSAILGIPNERAIPINADHRKIAKVSPRKEQRYLPVWASVKKLVEGSLMSSYTDNRKLLNHLFCVDYKVAQFRPRQPQRGTSQWIFTDPTYVSWLNSGRPSMLMLTGQPGTGKTVLTRCLVESILSGGGGEQQSSADYLGINFFCSYFETAINSEKAVLRSLLHQLIQLNPHCAQIIRNRLEKRTNAGLSISLEVPLLRSALSEVLSMHTMKRVFIVIDAIEELGIEIAISILSSLWQIVQDLSEMCPESRLRVFVSSRHNPAYSSALPNLTILSMRNPQMQRDINAYLQAVIEDFAAENSAFDAVASSSTKLNIVTQITRISNGMFLSAVLAWEDFRKGILWNQDMVARKLEKLISIGPGMTAFYDRMVNSINESTRDDAFSIFSILAAAAIPLSESEIGIILGICSSSRVIMRSTDFQPFRNLNDIIERNFPDLITIQDDNRLTFVHLSFKEYLQNREDFQAILHSGHRNITRSCLKYLKLKDLLQDACDGRSRADLVSEYSFLSYASSHFLYHIRSVPYDDSLWLVFADTAAKYSIYTLEALWPEHRSYRTSPLIEIIDRVPSPAMEALIRNFKEHGYDLDEKWSRHSCGRPLQHCCAYAGREEGKKRAAFLLLGLGANPSLPKKPWRSNLKRAIEGDAPDLYNALLHHPLTNLGDQDEQDQTLLHILVQTATIERISEVVDVIHDVDINIQDVNGYTPLHLATSAGRTEVIRKLLTVPGVRLDLADKQGRTPFTLATYWGLKGVALALIEHSQAFPVPEANQLSGLVFAAIHQQKALCSHLLEMSSYRNLHFHMDLSGKCILHHAAMNNWSDVLGNCLRLGAPMIKPNQIDHSGRSALHYAATLGNVDSCRVLVDHGASLTLQDRNGRTAAQAAADAGFKDVLMVLLRSGRVNPNQCDLEGRNLVHWAATLDCVDIMEAIRNTPGVVELARHDKHSKMPIDIAFQCKCKNVGQFLAREMRGTPGYFDIYDWDNMYCSPNVMAVEENLDDYRNPPQQQDAQQPHRVKQWEAIHRQYPQESWGLVRLSTTEYL